jgi:Peroxiredoxin
MDCSRILSRRLHFCLPNRTAGLCRETGRTRKDGRSNNFVSTDTHFVHMAWQRDEKLLEKVKFAMGADPTGKVSRIFGVYDEESGLALRGTFIINPEGHAGCIRSQFLQCRQKRRRAC